MRRVALAAIRFYQRYISPYKGFRCAYRVHTGCASCSVLGYRAIRRHGVVAGLSLLRKRTQRCGVAHREMVSTTRRTFRKQYGFCDMGCDLPVDCGCDLPIGKGASSIGEFLSCCDCASCDWSNRNRKKSDDEKYVVIRPKVKNRR